MNTKGNQHYQATHSEIQRALMHLLENYELKRISVRQICDLAGINRSTFYTHYPSVYDLWTDLDSVLRIGQMAYFQDANIHLENWLSEEGIASVLDYMYHYQNFYRGYISLLGTHEYIDSAFEELWTTNIVDQFWNKSISKKHMHQAFSFFMGGTLNLILLWLNEGCSTPIPELAQTVFSFTPDELKMLSL